MSLQDALKGEYAQWQGLPEAANREWLNGQVQPVIRFGDPEEKIRLGKRFRAITVERSVAPSPLEAWFAWDQDNVDLIEYDDAPVNDLEALLKLYGQPETILQRKRFAMDATVQEWVYAARGITLSIGTPFVAEAPRRLVHVQLYAARSLQYYLTVIGTGPEFHPY